MGVGLRSLTAAPPGPKAAITIPPPGNILMTFDVDGRTTMGILILTIPVLSYSDRLPLPVLFSAGSKRAPARRARYTTACTHRTSPPRAAPLGGAGWFVVLDRDAMPHQHSDIG